MMHEKKTIETYCNEFNYRNEYFLEEEKLKKNRSKNSPWSIEYYVVRYGMTVKEAQEAIQSNVKKRKKRTLFPHQLEFYLKKGYTLEEAKIRVEQYIIAISKNPKPGDWNYDSWKSKRGKEYKNFVKKFNDEREGRIMGCMMKGIGWNRIIELDGSLQSYSKAVDLVTRLSVAGFADLVENNEGQINFHKSMASKPFSLDHKFSTYGGYVNGISPWKIGSYKNLRVTSSKDNFQKGQYCCISKEEVLSYKTILDYSMCEESVRRIKNAFKFN